MTGHSLTAGLRSWKSRAGINAGRNGFAVHAPKSRYHLKALEGEFFGLAMVCFLCVAMQRMAPGTDIGFDLAAEYEQAKKMYSAPG